MHHLGISSIRKLDSEERVYNFQIEEDESYIANGVIVHNCIWVAIMADEVDPPAITGFDDTESLAEPSLSRSQQEQIVELGRRAVQDEVDRLLAEG